MATLKKGLDIVGPLGNLSIYQARGIDNMIVRQKGGPTREQVQHAPNFALTRLNNQEFTACALAGKHLRLTFVSLRNLSGGFNFSAPITGLMQLVQKQDTLNPKGARSIALSKYPDVLRGFPLNKTNLFDVIVRTTLEWSLDRATRTARVDIPALMRGINFVPQDDHALFRFEMSLGVAPDFIYNHDQKEYQPPQWYGTNNGTGTLKATTPWYASKQGCPSSTLEIALDRIPEDESYTLILTLGIRFGALYGDSIVKEVKYAGAAKILGAVGA